MVGSYYDNWLRLKEKRVKKEEKSIMDLIRDAEELEYKLILGGGDLEYIVQLKSMYLEKHLKFLSYEEGIKRFYEDYISHLLDLVGYWRDDDGDADS